MADEAAGGAGSPPVQLTADDLREIADDAWSMCDQNADDLDESGCHEDADAFRAWLPKSETLRARADLYAAAPNLEEVLRALLARAEWDCASGGDVHRDAVGGVAAADCPGCWAREILAQTEVRT